MELPHDLPEDADARLDYLIRFFEGRASGEKPADGSYGFLTVKGLGLSKIEAVNDWFSRLPEEVCAKVVWRVLPEWMFDYNFDTNVTKYAVYSRFALIPEAAQ